MFIRKIFFVWILIAIAVYPQYNTSIVTFNDNKVVIKFTFQENVDRNKDLFEQNNENVFLLAIPSNSKVTLRTLEKSVNTISIKDDFQKVRQQEKITLEQLKNINSKPDIEIKEYLNLRNYYCAAIQLNSLKISDKSKIDFINEIIVEATFSKPLINQKNQNNSYSKIYSNKIINYNQVQGLSTNSRNRNLSKENSSLQKNGLKIKIWEDGIYRITYDDLVNAGIDLTGFRTDNIVLRNGRQLIPMFFSIQEPQNFSEGDYIEFWATKNYGSSDYRQISESYPEYLNRYTDTTFLVLDYNSEFTNPLLRIQNSFAGSIDTVRRYTELLHFEEQERLVYFDNESPETQLPSWGNGKLWTWFPTWKFNNNKIHINISDASQVTNIKTTVRALSYASPVGDSNSHALSVAINNNLLDTLIFGWKDIVNYESVVDSGILKDGNNEIKLVKVPTNASTDWIEIDWIDFEFDQTLIFPEENEKFIFSLKQREGHQNSVVEIQNLSDTNIVIYRIAPNLKKIIDYELKQYEDKYTLHFSDSLDQTSRYIVQYQNGILAPRFNSIAYNTEINIGVNEYLIISNKLLSESVEEYGNFISEKYGYDVGIYYVDDIYNTYSNCYPYPEAIKEFLKNIYYSNLTQLPEFVIIIGDANYDYKNNWLPAPNEYTENLVPSYGVPVSDTWFTMVDSLNPNIQQYLIGRIPASNNEEVYKYLETHKNYLERDYDDWNKRVILYSGGFPDNPSELEALRITNEHVKHEFENSNQKSLVNHFYKTIDPFSNFGPIDYNDYSSVIDSGALYISYLGHSGTQTWDNGINEVSQLKNLVNGSQLMTDFGCSTGKFAEPDILSFSEIFTVKDQEPNAIGYIANSSLGYLSLATTLPIVFSQTMIDNPGISLGELHYLSKLNYFEKYGWLTPVNKVLNYGNCLLGDPALKIKIPELPNLSVSSKLSYVEKTISNPMDSVTIYLAIKNSGIFIDSTFNINVIHTFNNIVLNEQTHKFNVPFYIDTLKVKLFAKDLLGEHKIRIILDGEDNIVEYNENDNEYENSFIVYSSKFRYLENEKYFSINNGKIRLVNPSYNHVDKVKFQFSNSENFDSYSEYIVNTDTIITQISLENKVIKNERFWVKAGSANADFSVQEILSSVYSDDTLSWEMNEINKDVDLDGVIFDQDKNSFSLGEKERKIRVVSAGGYDGSTAIIEIDNEDIVGFNLWGMAVAVFDSANYNLIDKKIYRAGGEFLGDTLASYINSIDTGMVVAVAIGIEGRNYFLTDSQDSPARLALKTIGSVYIDSVGYRESWSIIGIKGAIVGSVPEVYHSWYEGPAIIDTNFVVNRNYGVIKLPSLSKIARWESGIVSGFTPDSTSILIRSIGKTINENDTINWNQQSDEGYSLSDYGLENYSSVTNEIIFEANNGSNSPVLNSFGIKYILVPELAINYQVVSLEQDTVDQGEDVNLSFFIYNVGESTADSFNVKVELVNSDNSKEKIFEELVDSISSESRRKFNIAYNTANFSGRRTFFISIDDENKVTELFEDNNYYSIPFYVVGDTTKPSLQVTVDGNEIFDGEYISPTPQIKVELTDESLVPITDTASVSIYLNNRYINYLNNSDELEINYSASNPKVTVNYNPILEDGEYTLRVFGKDATGNISDSAGIRKNFVVESKPKILSVYNYPNPFANDTYFTFKLTQIPDELKIKIFTVAGRLVKTINLNNAELNYDLNKIYWDGKDEDGDKLGNGVYLYKVIMKINNKKIDVTQKLAIVR